MSEPTQSCEVCGAGVKELRRGRCPVCYLRWADSRPVGLGAACTVCGDRRRDNLRSVEFHRRWLPMCHNCSAKAFRTQPVPTSIVALRRLVARDRRWSDRRVGRRDMRLFRIDRRRGPRRTSGRSDDAEYIDATDLIVDSVEDIGEAATTIAPAELLHKRE